MSDDDYAGIRAPEDAIDAASTVKDEHGDTWGDVLRFYAENRGTTDDVDAATVDVSELAAEIADEVDVDGESVDADAIAREVARHVDYAELATRVADEVEGRLR